MTTEAIKSMLTQRLVRNTPVVVADTASKGEIHGMTLKVASKTTVKCNKGGRCAGDGSWCVGLAVFLADPTIKKKAPRTKKAKKKADMGWRSGTTKLCLTHLKDEEGNLILPPPSLIPRAATTRIANPGEIQHEGVVTWEDIACAARDQDLNLVIFLARKLKRENEELKSKLLDAQQKLLATL